MNLPSGNVNSACQTIDAAPLKVLILDEEIPFPLNSGKRIRTWNLLRHLAPRHQITFVCYGESQHPKVADLRSLGIRVIVVPDLPATNSARFYAGALTNLLSRWPYSVSRHNTRRYREAVRRALAAERFDLVHCEWTPYASYGDSIAGLPLVIMAHNMETTVWTRRAQHASSLAERAYMRIQAWKMMRFERSCFAKAARVVAVTDEEQQMAQKWGARATSLVANGVDTDYLRPHVEKSVPNSLLFLGSLDWQPNRDALLYLLREIFPLIQATAPQATLRVVGRQPTTKLREQVNGISNVEWVGEVPDIRPYFAGASAVLVPLRIGGGSRIKILESLSMGKAVVATSIGAEGLNVISGQNCLIADTPQQFSEAVVHLLRHPEHAEELGRNGRRLVMQEYDWSQSAQALEQAWRETMSSFQPMAQAE